MIDLFGGINVIFAFQSLGEWLHPIMAFFSFLGTEDFYILALPVIYWSLDSALGLRVGVMMLLSSGMNTIFKFMFHSPRPYWVNTEVKAYAAEASFGIPSGHAQNAISVWGMVGTYFRKRWVWALTTIVILGISLSRTYLAVHYPVDTVLGLFFGFLLLVAVNRAWNPVAGWAKKQTLAKQIGVAFLGSLAMLFLGVFVAWMFRDWTLPVAWEQAAKRAGDEALHPYAIAGLITSSATLFGLFAGVAFVEEKGGFSAAGTPKERFLRYLLGLVGLLIFYIGLKVIFPSGENFLAYVFRFLRYSLVGFWVSGGAPFIFVKTKLANSPNEQSRPLL